MVEVKVYSGGSVSTQTVDESRFGERVLVRTLKDAVVMYEANLRQGNAKTKSRGEVAGPNSKMWKQKHTGRARMGSKKVVHWRGGGTAFGPKPRDYSYHTLTGILCAQRFCGFVDGFRSQIPNRGRIRH